MLNLKKFNNVSCMSEIPVTQNRETEQLSGHKPSREEMRTTPDRERAREYLKWQSGPRNLSALIGPTTWDAGFLRTETAPDFSRG